MRKVMTITVVILAVAFAASVTLRLARLERRLNELEKPKPEHIALRASA
jgi:hypothetical protein